jgi:uncharacterized protein YqeY
MTSTSLRDRLTDDLKTAMKAGETARVSAVRLIIAKMKEADIAARPKGIDRISDEDLVPVLRSMVKQRNDSIALYKQGNREELAAREQAEITIIEAYLPAGLDAAGLDAAVDAAIAQTGATSAKDLGRVMGALKSAHGAALDMGRANELARARLSP